MVTHHLRVWGLIPAASHWKKYQANLSFDAASVDPTASERKILNCDFHTPLKKCGILHRGVETEQK